ncbi:hypothetical protein ACFQ0M_13635 [Kitasatospora aburaviensis]
MGERTQVAVDPGVLAGEVVGDRPVDRPVDLAALGDGERAPSPAGVSTYVQVPP